jgi:hypothetical protein
MAHIQDRWYRKAVDPGSGKITREKTTLHGKGDRYKARYVDPGGTERSKTFPDRQKKQAEDFLIAVENDKREGRYLDPRGSRVTFREQAENWIKGQSDDPATRAVLRSRLRSKILPVLGGLLVSRISPSTIREWMETAEDQSDNYKHALFTLATSALDSAVEDKLIRQNPCKVKTIQRPAGAADQVKDVWSEQRVKAVRDAMSACWRIIVPLARVAGCDRVRSSASPPTISTARPWSCRCAGNCARSTAPRSSPCRRATRPARCRCPPGCTPRFSGICAPTRRSR